MKAILLSIGILILLPCFNGYSQEKKLNVLSEQEKVDSLISIVANLPNATFINLSSIKIKELRFH